MKSYILVPDQANMTTSECIAAIKEIDCQGIKLLSCECFHADVSWSLILKIEADLREQEAVYIAMLRRAGIFSTQLLHIASL